MPVPECLDLRTPGHRAVGVHQLAQHGAGFQPGDPHQLDASFGVPLPPRHSVGMGAEREDMPGPDLAFSAPLHYHAEYELIHVESGRGTEFVGSGFAPYEAGTLTLIGSHTPHLHLCDRETSAGATSDCLLSGAAMENDPVE